MSLFHSSCQRSTAEHQNSSWPIADEASGRRNLPIDYWTGHSNSEMGSTYAKQLFEDVGFRTESGPWFELAQSAPFVLSTREI
jgi:hypothetical protein